MRRLENKLFTLLDIFCCIAIFALFLLVIQFSVSAKSDENEKVLTVSEVLENKSKYVDQDILILIQGKVGFGTDTIGLWEDIENGPSLFISLGKIDFSDPAFDRKDVVLQGKIEHRPCKFQVPDDEDYYVFCGIYLVVYGIIHIE